MGARLCSGALGPAAPSLLQSDAGDSPGVLPGKFPQSSTRSQGCRYKKQHLISQCMTLSNDMFVISSWPISQALWLLLSPRHLHSTWGEAFKGKKKLPGNVIAVSYRNQSWAPTPLKLQHQQARRPHPRADNSKVNLAADFKQSPDAVHS